MSLIETETESVVSQLETEIADETNQQLNTDETSCQVHLNTSVQSSSSGGSGKRHRNRSRKRKRDLYRKIRDQIEYYFSNSNLRHDRFMRKLTGVDPDDDEDYVGDEQQEQQPEDDSLAQKTVDELKNNNQTESESDNIELKNEEIKPGTRPVLLPLFLKFNKISELTNDHRDIVKSFKYNFNSNEPIKTNQTLACPTLVLDEKSNTISRSEPFYNQDNHEANNRTVYVEGFSSQTADDIHSWLRKMFHKFIRFGQVEDQEPATTKDQILSIRTPRYRHTRQLMGFAFIEFNDQSLVSLVCKNAANFISQKLEQQKSEIQNHHSTKDESNINLKKRKLDDAAEEGVNEGEEVVEEPAKQIMKMTENSIKCHQPESNTLTDETLTENCDNLEKQSSECAKNLENENQQKSKDVVLNSDAGANNNLVTENNNNDIDELSEMTSQIDDIVKLRVMPKFEWIKYKNRYLKLQREALAQVRRLNSSFYYRREESIPFRSDLGTNCQENQKSISCSRRPSSSDTDTLKRTHSVSSNKNFTATEPNQFKPSEFPANPVVAGSTGPNVPIVHYPDPIVQIQFTVVMLADADADRIRKSFKAIFEKCADSAATPTLKDIGYIDISASMCSFNEDGTVQQKCFIRVRNPEAAAKLQTEQFRKNLEDNLLNGSCRNFQVLLLNEEQTSQYWHTVNSLKAKSFKHGKKSRID